VSHPERHNDPPAVPWRARLLGRAGSLFIRLLAATLRLRVVGRENLRKAKADGAPILYVLWHGSQLLPLAWFRDRGILIMSSLSADGEIQNASLRALGYRTVRGSSSRGGMRALLTMVRAMSEGGDASLTVDGPRGPLHQAKPGAVLLAQRAKAAVVPVGVHHRFVHRLPRSWDGYQVPLPGSRSVLVIGEPFTLGPDVDLATGARLLEERIAAAEALAARSNGETPIFANSCTAGGAPEAATGYDRDIPSRGAVA